MSSVIGFRLRLCVLWLACVGASGISLTWMLFAAIAGSPRALRIAVGHDQTVNAAVGGDEDETISARCWRYRGDPKYSALVQIINLMFFDSRHCERAYLSERTKRCSTQ